MSGPGTEEFVYNMRQRLNDNVTEQMRFFSMCCEQWAGVPMAHRAHAAQHITVRRPPHATTPGAPGDGVRGRDTIDDSGRGSRLQGFAVLPKHIDVNCSNPFPQAALRDGEMGFAVGKEEDWDARIAELYANIPPRPDPYPPIPV